MIIRSLALIVLLGASALFSCTGPGAREDLVALYAVDERDMGGTMAVSLQRLDVEGQAEFGGKTVVYYVASEMVPKILENPELLEAFVPRPAD